jgi:hypothetical protein
MRAKGLLECDPEGTRTLDLLRDRMFPGGFLIIT